MIRQVAEIGRLKKMEKLPLDLINDWRRAVSIMGPRTKARTMGAASKEIFFIGYPITPKTSMMATSVVLLLME